MGNILIDKKATISICMITYNHANFIKDSIENILNQIVEVQIELIICDDCSSDNTEFIINKIINEHVNGSLIKYFRQNENIGMEKNFIFALKKCSGKYIAFCEGDDYWNDNYKLKKQINFLENNNIYSACFHNVKVLNEVDSDKKIYDWPDDKEIGLADLFQGMFMKTCSLMIKNEQGKFSSMYLGLVPADDISLGFSVLSDGSKAIYLSDSMSVYRIHAGGIWSSKTYRDKILWSAKNQIKYIHFFRKNSSLKILQTHFRGQMTQAIKYSISNTDLKLFFKSIFYFIRYGFNY